MVETSNRRTRDKTEKKIQNKFKKETTGVSQRNKSFTESARKFSGSPLDYQVNLSNYY